MTLSKLDIFKPLPQEVKGKYDVVHLRFFMAVAVDDNIQIVIKNLKGMLSKYDFIDRFAPRRCAEASMKILNAGRAIEG